MYPKEFRYDDDNNEQMDFCDKGFQCVVETVESFGVSGLQKKKKAPVNTTKGAALHFMLVLN